MARKGSSSSSATHHTRSHHAATRESSPLGRAKAAAEARCRVPSPTHGPQQTCAPALPPVPTGSPKAEKPIPSKLPADSAGGRTDPGRHGTDAPRLSSDHRSTMGSNKQDAQALLGSSMKRGFPHESQDSMGEQLVVRPSVDGAMSPLTAESLGPPTGDPTSTLPQVLETVDLLYNHLFNAPPELVGDSCRSFYNTRLSAIHGS